MENLIVNEKCKLFWGYFICCFGGLFDCFQHTRGPGFWYLEFAPVFIGFFLILAIKTEKKQVQVLNLFILAAAVADAAAVTILFTRMHVGEHLSLVCLAGLLFVFLKVFFSVGEICRLSRVTVILFISEMILLILIVLLSLFYMCFTDMSGALMDSAVKLERMAVLKNTFQYSRLAVSIVSLPFLLNDVFYQGPNMS